MKKEHNAEDLLDFQIFDWLSDAVAIVKEPLDCVWVVGFVVEFKTWTKVRRAINFLLEERRKKW